MLPVEERVVHIPAISSGIFGFPLKRCCKVIVTSMLERIDEMTEDDKENLKNLSRHLMKLEVKADNLKRKIEIVEDRHDVDSEDWSEEAREHGHHSHESDEDSYEHHHAV